MSEVDVLIATALEMERDAVRDAATWREGPSGAQHWEDKDTNKQPEYSLGDYILPQGGSIKIALARPTWMGGIFTANVVSALMERLDPRCLAMCGVCAGNPADVALGDVVIASTVFQYDRGKQNAENFEADLFPTPTDIAWVQRARDLRPDGLPSHGIASGSDASLWLLERLYAGADPLKHPAFARYFPRGTWEERITRMEQGGMVRREGRTFIITNHGKEFVDRELAYTVDPPSRLPFAILVGPMASGNAVVKDGVTWDMLKRTGGQRSTIALEMEAASIGAAGYGRSSYKWIVVKGVMDHADPKKDDRYKPFAARASAEVLLRFLEQNADSIKRNPVRSRSPSGREHETVPARAAEQDPEPPAQPFPFLDENDSGRLTVLVVCRESGSEALITVTERALALGRSSIEELSAKSIAVSPQQIGENVFRLNVGRAFASRATMIDCLRAISRADVAIFDVTGGGEVGIEPGVMLLLGVRAVARRGVSICSVDHDPDQLFDVDLPYNLQQLNIASHAGRFGELDAPERLAAKISSGLHDLDHDLTYLDLPAFDSIRTLGGDIRDYAPIPFYRGPLYLGPFDESFQQACFHNLEPEVAVLLDRIAREKDGRDYKRPRIFRLLDYDRARMVSQSLYHSIRRHDFCLIDWTWLRPNVFFEFGVRLASRQSGDVHIVADLEGAEAELNDFKLRWPRFARSVGSGRDATKLAQAKGLRQIFAPIEYRPQSVAKIRAACAVILERWRATRELSYDNGTIFDEIARAAAPPSRGAVEAVVEFLHKRALLTYLHDQDTLLGTLLYEEHNSALQKAAVAQSIALKLAALFLTVSSRSPSRRGLMPSDEVEDLAQQIRRLARRIGTEQDVGMLNACLDAIRDAFVPQ
jgi:nucleoside phosphorylase